MGEVTVPEIAPAVANAVFALTGKRLRGSRSASTTPGLEGATRGPPCDDAGARASRDTAVTPRRAAGGPRSADLQRPAHGVALAAPGRASTRDARGAAMTPKKKKLQLSKDTLRHLREADTQRVRGGLIASVFCTLEYGCSSVVTCVTVCAGHCSTSG
jgi:hypothetical protein